MSEQPQRSDIPHLQDWANAMAFVASHYRQSYSPGTLHAAAEWATQKTLPDALKHLCRHAGLHCQFLNGNDRKMSAWRLPLVVQLKDRSDQKRKQLHRAYKSRRLMDSLR